MAIVVVVRRPRHLRADGGFHSGGPRAGAMRGGEVDSPRCARISRTVTASVMKAIIRGSPPHLGQRRGENFMDAREQQRPGVARCPAMDRSLDRLGRCARRGGHRGGHWCSRCLGSWRFGLHRHPPFTPLDDDVVVVHMRVEQGAEVVDEGRGADPRGSPDISMRATPKGYLLRIQSQGAGPTPRDSFAPTHADTK